MFKPQINFELLQVGCDCAQDNRTGEMCDFFLSRVPELLKHICVVEFNPKIQSHGIGDYDRIFSHVTFWLTINNAKIFLTDVNEVELALIRSIDGSNFNFWLKNSLLDVALYFSKEQA